MENKQPTNLPYTNRSAQQQFHGAEPVRGLAHVPHSALHEGRFGRMFRNLPPCAPEDADLVALADMMIDPLSPKGKNGSEAEGDSNIPAGFTYFGQFIDHDITFDPTSKLQRENDPNALHNFRTPRFDLDSVYANGPADQPFLYTDGAKFLLGKEDDNKDDLPRNSEGRALIGDPRNDENLIIAQLHLAFLKYHNHVVEAIRKDTPPDQLFDQARRIVRWHYQWLVVHDFLRRIVGDAVLSDILKPDKFVIGTAQGTDRGEIAKVDLKFYHYKNQPFIPVEFSGAAYRFGHSMVRPEYELNEDAQDIPIFAPDEKVEDDLHGFRKRPRGREIEWPRFFAFPESSLEVQHARKIDTHLAQGLHDLPENVTGKLPATPIGQMLKSLAVRNLLRGKALGLPSGQAIARAMGIPDEFILSGDDLDFTDPLLGKFVDDTPLWFYILKEAEKFCEGEQLGPVGGRIVAEVLIGLLQGDPLAYLNVEPNWHPEPNLFGAGPSGKNFMMADLLRFAMSPELTISSIVQPKKETKMSWLFILRYNHKAWKGFTKAEEQEAREAAEYLFPYEGIGKPLDSLSEFKVVDTFHTVIHSKLPPGYIDMSKEERAKIMDEILADLPESDKGVGWIAIVPDDQVKAFKAALGDNATGADQPFKRMYIVEAIPLNDDQTSKAIYEHMSPQHWNHPAHQ